MNLKDAESLNYLESVSIPFYRSQGGAFITTTLHLCKTLETIYRKKRAAKKADTIAVTMRDIYEDMIFWPNNI
ncbi:MAG: hypothetical protein FWE42_07715 [Defluviitaleaceae bacterium]|nr:hypothetical protein [Defluviitaleaceae bacterium]